MASDNFLALIEKRRPDIEKMLAEWMTPERFFAMAMQIKRNPELSACSDDSLVECVVQAAQLGLEIGGTRGHFYVIKYGNAAQGQPGWRGLAFLRLKAGSVMSVDTDVVFKEDRFNISRSSDGDKFEHVLNVLGCERSEPNAVGAYAKVVLPTGEIQFEWTSRDRVQRHRQHSKQPDGLLWNPKKFWEEGWRKTPYRILDKRLPDGANEKAMERYAMAVQVENANYRIRNAELDLGPELDDPDPPTRKAGKVEVVKDEKPPPKEQSSAGKQNTPPASTADDPITEDEQDDIYTAADAKWGKKSASHLMRILKSLGVDDLSAVKQGQLSAIVEQINLNE